jgi:hypothetical protein
MGYPAVSLKNFIKNSKKWTIQLTENK